MLTKEPNWKTNYFKSDDAIEELMQNYLKSFAITPKDVFRKIKNLEIDFHPYCKISDETIHEVANFMVKYKKENKQDLIKLYQKIKFEDIFDQLQDENKGSLIKYTIFENSDGIGSHYNFKNTPQELINEFQSCIDELGDSAPEMNIFKCLINENYEIIYKKLCN